MSAKSPAADVTVSVYGITDVGAVRKNNEDAFLVAELTTGQVGVTREEILCRPIRDRGMLLVVSDGMGGAEAGEIASQLVVQNVSRELINASADHQPEDLVRVAVERTNNLVLNEAAVDPRKRGMGATLVAAWIAGTVAYITWIGDSRGYLMRAGRLRQITRDQSMVESLVEAKVLTRAEAQTHPQRNVILQAMGARPQIVVPLERLDLRRGDILLLCSDGLTGVLQDDEMRDCLLTTPTVRDACTRMITIALERGASDNVTVVLGELDGDGLPAPPRDERLTRTIDSVASFDFKTGGGYASPPAAHPTVPLGSQPIQPKRDGDKS